MKNVGHATAQNHRLSVRILAFMLAFSMLLGVCPTVFAEQLVITTSDVHFAGMNADGTVKNGEPFGLQISGGFGAYLENSTNPSAVDPEVRVYVGDMADETFVSLASGGKIETTGEPYVTGGLQFSVKWDVARNQYYVLVERFDTYANTTRPWAADDTFNTSLGAYFDNDASNGTTWNVELDIIDKNTGNSVVTKTAEVTSQSSVEVTQNKTVDVTNVQVGASSGVTTLGTDITYTLGVSTGNKSASNVLSYGEAIVTEYIVTDTFALPEGLYINESDFASAVTFEGMNNPTINKTKDGSGRVTGFELTYTATNTSKDHQISDLAAKMKLKGDYVQVMNEFTKRGDNAADITNKISTSYKSTNNPTDPINLGEVPVTTKVSRPTAAEYTNPQKIVEDAAARYGTWDSWNDKYLVVGDYVVYKLTFKNSGQEKLTGGTVTDTPVNGLTVVKPDNTTAQEIYNIKSSMWKYSIEKIQRGAWTDNPDVVVNVDTNNNKVEFTNITLNKDETFTGYVLAKVSDNVTDKTTLTNKAVFGGKDERTADVIQKPTTANVDISKTVTATSTSGKTSTTGYNAGDSVEYVVKISNTGSADAKDVKITDLFPCGVIDVESITVDDITWSNTTGDGKSQTVNLEFGTKTIPAKGSVEIKINGKIKSDVKDSQIINTATSVYNNETKTASATLNRILPASYVDIKKIGDHDNQYAAVGEIIKYTIVADLNEQTFDESEPLFITDKIPAVLTYNSSEITSPDGTNVSETIASDGSIVYTVTGTGTITIVVSCKVNENAEGSFKNTAVVTGGGNASSGTTTIGSANQYNVEKSAVVTHAGETDSYEIIKARDDRGVMPGDTITFKIKVTNNSGKDLTDFTLNEDLNGLYKLYEDRSVHLMDISISDSSKAYGVDKNYNAGENETIYATGEHGETLWNQPIGTRVKTYGEGNRLIFYDSTTNNVVPWPETSVERYANGTAKFLFTNDFTVPNQRQWNYYDYWYNPEFKIEDGGYIELSYSVTLAGDGAKFDKGSNSAWIGYDTPSTVSYHKVEATPAPEVTPDPSATADPSQPVLEIDKKVSRTYEDAVAKKYIKEIIYSDENALTDRWNKGIVLYRLDIKNTSDKVYETTNATFLDRLPDQYELRANNASSELWCAYGDSVGRVAGFSVAKVAADANGDEDYRGASWTNVTQEYASQCYSNRGSYDANWLAISLDTDYKGNFRLGPGQHTSVWYWLVLKPEVVNEIKNEAKQKGWFEFEKRTATNTAYFTADKFFNNTDGKTVRVISDTETVTVRSESEHPGLTKTAYAYLEEAGNSIKYESNSAHPGAHLIWKLRIDNKKDTNGTGLAMSKYTLTDLLPKGYIYTKNQTYENSYTEGGHIKYPDNMAEPFNQGKFVKYTLQSDGSYVTSYIEPNADGITFNDNTTTLEWQFDGSQNKDLVLNAGDYMEFTVLTECSDTNKPSGVFYNKAILESNGRYYEDTVTVGTVEDGNITDGDSFSINTIVTSGQISVQTAEETNKVNGDDPDNIASAVAGETVRYTMTVRNDDGTQDLTNLTVINRLPYVGDSGVIVSGQRGSEFNVTYKDSLKIVVKSSDGTEKKTLTASQYDLTTYSGDASKTFEEFGDDWTDKNAEGWTSEWNDSTKLVRIQLGSGVVLSKGEYIEISYDAKLPNQGSEKDQVAWNGFAYHYTGVGKDTDMAAEPKSVGVELPKNITLTGKITVKKVFALDSGIETTKTFWISIYDGKYGEGGNKLETKSVDVTTSGNLKKPSNAEVEFTELPYTEIGKQKLYYIYETDKDGVPIAQNYTSNGYAMCKGFYRPDKGTYSTIYDKNNTELQKVTPTDTDTVQYVYATDDKGSNKVEYVQEGSYCFWYKGLSSTQTTNSAIFSNLARTAQTETTKEIFGPYYSDIATNYESTKADKGYVANKQTTGVVRDRDRDIVGTVTKRDDYDSNEKADRNIKKTYESGVKVDKSRQYVFGNGWGNAEGHTVATGFMAKITGGSDNLVINNVMWDIKSDPAHTDGVFVRLAKGTEYDAFSQKMSEKGYTLTQAFADGEDLHGSTVYRIDKDTTKVSLTEAASSVDMSGSDEHDSGVVDDESAALKANDDGISFDNDNDDSFSAEDEAMLAEQAELNEVTTLNWKISDTVPAITLRQGAVINVGIIIDQLYDKNATAEFVINPTEKSQNTAEGSKITSYDKQADVPAFNLSGEYQALGISTVLKPIETGKTYYFGNNVSIVDDDKLVQFESSNIQCILADNNINTDGENEPHFMICAGNYKDSSGKPKNDVTVNDNSIRVGSYQSNKDNYIVNKQPTPTIAVKIPAGGAKLTFTMTSLPATTRYLTILERNESGTYERIKGTDGNEIALPVGGENAIESGSVNIAADSERIVYITSTGSNINIKSIAVADYVDPTEG